MILSENSMRNWGKINKIDLIWDGKKKKKGFQNPGNFDRDEKVLKYWDLVTAS